MLAERDRRGQVLDPLLGELGPGALLRGADQALDGRRLVVARSAPGGERGLVGFDHLLDHPGRGESRQIEAARRTGHGQGQPDHIVSGVADDGLVQVADLHLDLVLGIGHRPEIAIVAVAADPDRRSLGQAQIPAAQPVVEPGRGPADVALRRARHLQMSPRPQEFGARFGGGRGGGLALKLVHAPATRQGSGGCVKAPRADDYLLREQPTPCVGPSPCAAGVTAGRPSATLGTGGLRPG